MRHLGRHLVLAACLFATGAIASAAPAHKGKVTKKQAKKHAPVAADDQPDGDDARDDETGDRRDGTRVAHESWSRHRDADRDSANDDDSDDVKPARHAKAVHGHTTDAEDLFADDGSEHQARTAERRSHTVPLHSSDSDGDAPSRHMLGAHVWPKHHVDLDASAGDDDRDGDRDMRRDAGRMSLKKTAKHHSDVETLPSDDDADVAPRSHRKRHSDVETLPSDDDAEVSHPASRKKPSKHHSAVETLPSDDDAEIPNISVHKKTGRRAAASHRKAAKHHADDDSEGSPANDETAANPVAANEPGLTAKHQRVAFADPDQPAHAIDADTIQIDNAVHVHKLVEPEAKDWRVAFGPYLWASAVDANVSLGPTTVSSGVDFVQLEQHARYGMEFLGEAHYKQLGVYGDLMYGVVAVDGSRDVGPLMVSLNGEASSVLIDGAAGYTFYGDDHSLLSLEGRAGVRYQRTGVSAQLGLSGATVTPAEQVSAGADALAGGHVVVRPRDWFFLTGTADIGVVGASSRTWSASADANVQLGARLLLTVGYRTLTMDRSQVDLVLHGPRAAFQLTF